MNSSLLALLSPLFSWMRVQNNICVCIYIYMKARNALLVIHIVIFINHVLIYLHKKQQFALQCNLYLLECCLWGNFMALYASFRNYILYVESGAFHSENLDIIIIIIIILIIEMQNTYMYLSIFKFSRKKLDSLYSILFLKN